MDAFDVELAPYPVRNKLIIIIRRRFHIDN